MSADLALAADPSVIERAADPGEFIIQACERAKTWLAQALEHGDIDQIAEFRSQADAIRVYTMSKQLGKDAQLSATEIVRRAERGIGVAIRRGQAEGTIRSKQQGQPRKFNPVDNQVNPRPVTDFATYEELTGNGAGIYDLTDDTSDADFDAAISEARGEGNLTRANVVRKVRSRQPPADLENWIPDPADRASSNRLQRSGVLSGPARGPARPLHRERAGRIPAGAPEDPRVLAVTGDRPEVLQGREARPLPPVSRRGMGERTGARGRRCPRLTAPLSARHRDQTARHPS